MSDCLLVLLPSLRSLSIHSPYRDRSQQAGLDQGCVLGELCDVGPGQSLFRREGLVADDAIGPEVDDLDLEAVARRLDRVGHVHAEGRRPEHAEVLAVETDLG